MAKQTGFFFFYVTYEQNVTLYTQLSITLFKNNHRPVHYKIPFISGFLVYFAVVFRALAV